MAARQVKKQIRAEALIPLVLILIITACAGTEPPPKPTTPPESTAVPELTNTPQPTAVPQPVGAVDTGLGGTLSVRGVVKDDRGNPIPNIHVFINANATGVYWDRTGEEDYWLGEWDMYTDADGGYAFNNLFQAEGGHHQLWFSGVEAEGGQAYEGSRYYIIKEPDRVYTLFKELGYSHFTYYPDENGDTYMLDVVMRPDSGSALSGVFWYEDADGVTKNYFATPFGPDHGIELNRGDPESHEYTVDNGFTSDGSQVYLDGLAGGTYYLVFHFGRSDGTGAGCTIPGIEIPPGETKALELTIPPDACEIVE